MPWATRGSIGHGCNTPCVEIVDGPSGRRLILDAGSGIVGVGATLDAVATIPIVLTHYHWDHVQGLPFFAPVPARRGGDRLGTRTRPAVRRYRDDVRMAIFPGAVRSAAVASGGQDERNGERRHPWVPCVRATAESSRRLHSRIASRERQAISCMRPTTSLETRTSISRSRIFHAAPARSYSIRISRPKKRPRIEDGAQRLVAVRAFRRGLRCRSAVAVPSQTRQAGRGNGTDRIRGSRGVREYLRRQRGRCLRCLTQSVKRRANSDFQLWPWRLF